MYKFHQLSVLRYPTRLPSTNASFEKPACFKTAIASATVRRSSKSSPSEVTSSDMKYTNKRVRVMPSTHSSRCPNPRFSSVCTGDSSAIGLLGSRLALQRRQVWSVAKLTRPQCAHLRVIQG